MTHVRLVGAEEIGAWAYSVSVPFLNPANTEDRRVRWEGYWRPHVEIGRTWAVEDRDRFVGNAAIFTRTITLPGGAGSACPVVPLAAVTAVGVHPTHRRQGLLRGLMGTMLADARARGETVAGLLASEASIYGRFGFGPATQAATYVIDPRRSAFAVGPAPVELSLLQPGEAAKVLPDIFRRACARQPGQVDRDETTWDQMFADLAEDRGGASALSYVACPGGFATWRTKEIADFGHDSCAQVRLQDVVAESAEIEAALWRFVLDLDLVREVVAFPRPVDEPIRARLTDPRQLRTTGIDDFLWLRIVDTAAALTARGYLRWGRLVLDVRPPPATPGADGRDGPDPAAGRWLLEAGPDGASCSPAGRDQATDLVLGVAELSALLAGGARASVLAAAGRLEEERPGALDVADGLFASRPAPMTVTGF